MFDKNRIEQFVVSMKKEITGKGPKNVLVEVDGNIVRLTVLGLLTKLEKQVIEFFPEMESIFIKTRLYADRKYLRSYKKEISEILGGKIQRVDIEHKMYEDKVIIILEVAK